MSDILIDPQQELEALRKRVSALETELAAAQQTSLLPTLEPDLYSLLFNMTQDMIFVHTLGTGKSPGRFTEVNSAVIETLGYSRAELIELTTQDIILNPLDNIEETRDRLLQEGTMLFDVVLVAKDGTNIPAELNARTFTLNGEPLTISMGRNLSEQRQAEKAYHDLVDNSLQGMAIFHGRKPIFASKAIERITGYTVEEYLTMSDEELWEMVHPDDLERIRSYQRARLAGEPSPEHYEYRIITKNGDMRWVEIRTSAVEYKGRPASQGTFIDITERKQAEEAYRDLVDNSLQAMVIMQDGNPVFANKAVERISGFTLEEYLQLSGADLWAMVHPDERKRLRNYDQARRTGKPAPDQYEYRTIDRNGVLRWLETRASVIEYKGRPAVQGTFFDITERRQVKEALEQLAAELMLINEVTSKITSELGLETVLEHAAQLIHDTFGYEHIGVFMFDEPSGYLLMRARAGKYVDLFPPDHRLKLGQGIVGSSAIARAPILANDVKLEPRFVNPFAPEQVIGSELSVPLQVGDQVVGVLDVQSREVNAIKTLDILVLETLADSLATAIQNASLYAQVQEHAADMEERVAVRTAELAAAVERLEELDRVKDEFIAKVSHELRTPLTNLKLYHYLMETRPEQHSKYLQTLKRETERLRAIVENLLYVSRMNRGMVPLHKSRLNLEAVLVQYITDRSLLAENRGLTLSFEKAQAIPPVQADLHLIEQLIGVLLTNAINYTPEGGYIVVKTRTSTFDDKQWVGFSVIDNGPGISKVEQTHIFERFYRGSAASDLAKPGTGLGLTIAEDIVNQHQGRLEVFSDGIPGKGTTFTVWLPVA